MGIYIRDYLGSLSAREIEESIRLLPEWRRDRAMRYSFPEGRRNCSLAYHLLCRALKEEYGITAQPTFVAGEHGKPSLLEFPDIHFNLSHCPCAIVCAVSERPVGIDVECVRRTVSPALLRHTMNTEEQEEVAKDPMAFFRLWTRKEALVKMLGTGLHDGIPELLSPENLCGVSLTTDDRSEDRGYVLSVAIRNA